MSGLPQVAVVGCGRWGRNLVRNFAELGALAAVVDVEPSTAQAISEQFGAPAVDLATVLADPRLDGVVVAVPAVSHATIARDALAAAKHVFVEKPLAVDVREAQHLCAMAEANGQVLMVGHLLQYHPAFLALERLVRDGELGSVEYVYSTRLNLGRIRREEDILWSFAPHDVSMILALIGSEPESVWAVGSNHLHPHIADVTTTHLRFPGGERAHIFVSWLHPYKEQRLVAVGDKAMAVFDDGQPWPSKLRVYRHAITWHAGIPEAVKAEAEHVSLEPQEPLAMECRHFLDCILTGAAPRTDGWEGLRVLRVLDAAERSMSHATGGERITRRPGVFIHESAYIDEPCEIGEGTRIWHFTHVLAGTRIGRNCTIGQNVMIGPDVTVGDNCKIQNNVSVYRGVTLEDGVFCGPSCVFTNVSNPRAEVDRKAEFEPTWVGRGATIGANATVVCGNRIGPWSFVAAGAVVTSDVPAYALVAGVPARRIGWVSHDGERLGEDLVCPRSGRRYRLVAPEVLEELPGG